MEAESSKRKGKFGNDGKRRTGFIIDPKAPMIDLQKVAEADSTGLMMRMSNLEK